MAPEPMAGGEGGPHRIACRARVAASYHASSGSCGSPAQQYHNNNTDHEAHTRPQQILQGELFCTLTFNT